MPTFKVSVADRETGRESHITVEADDGREAMAKVADGDTLVSGVVEVTAPPPPTARTSSAAPSPPTEATNAMLLAELKQMRSWLPLTIAKGVLLSYLALLGLAAVVWFLQALASGIG